MYLKKHPLPLKKSLELLDENGLATYEVVLKKKIENKEVLKSLGTKDYIQWVLRDKDVPPDSPVHQYLLFITYYQLPDRVPHVPEECYTGGGYQKITSENITFKINSSGPRQTVPGTYLIFSNKNASYWQHSVAEFPVLYFFRINGVYVNRRGEARATLNKNIFGKHSYFCKVELVFNQQSPPPDKEEAVQAGQRLLRLILPILEAEHWPEWEES
jgi:hypothetical protein